MQSAGQIRIVEVGPRDGLQNESKIIDKDVKIEFINRLSTVGFQTIEVTRWVRVMKRKITDFLIISIIESISILHCMQFCQSQMDTTIRRQYARV